MNPERWQEVEDIFQKVLEAGDAGRASVLEDSCAGDTTLRRQVEWLLNRYRKEGEAAAAPEASTTPVPAPAPSRSGGTFSAGIPVNSLVGHYHILKKVGGGGMGLVYEAEDLRLRRRVALKFLPDDLAQHPQAVQRLRFEARAASALNHPNICTIYEVDEVDGRVFIAMELLDGQTLRHLLREENPGKPIPVPIVLDLGRQIAAAIDAAHAKNIVHRDIKPANIFVIKQNRIKVLDFGLAKLSNYRAASENTLLVQTHETQSGIVVGTVGYMSPEQARGQTVDRRADLFAFGAILYEMLAGRHPFEKGTAPETMAAILTEAPRPLSEVVPGIPLALDRIVKRCLEKDPEQRFQSASDLSFALETLSSLSAESAPAARKERLFGSIGLALGVGALIVLSITWWRTPPSQPVVESITQLTDNGEPKEPGQNLITGKLFTDGSRIYFNEGLVGSWRIAQVAVSGGPSSIIDTKLANPSIIGLAPNGSAMLALDLARNSAASPLWSVPIPAGEPRRLAGIKATGAGYFPDGRIVYTEGNDVFAANNDGSDRRKLLSVAGRAFSPRISPDGQQGIVQVILNGVASLLEFAADGSGAHTLNLGPDFCCGASWSSDGKYLVYEVRDKSSSDIWAAPMRSGLFERSGEPVRLTSGPLFFTSPSPSRDGKQVFAIGANRRGELTRYDMQSHQFLPFLDGISAREPSFSRDGQWVTYVSYPDGLLWRSRSDGTERKQLTYPPAQVRLPRISPDGTEVSFSAWVAETSSEESFVLDINGAQPAKAITSAKSEWVDAAEWSPSGNLLLLSMEGRTPGERSSAELRVADLRNGTITVLPSSQGMLGGKWISENSIIAATWDGTKFRSFDRKTGKWTDLIAGAFTGWEPSPDGKYLYYTTGGTEPEAWRLRFADGQVEPITTLKDPSRAARMGWLNGINAAPDGSPLFTRDTGSEEIYALNVRWP